MHGGPTYVMRDEHAQMRDVLDQLAAALSRRDTQAYLGMSETLLMLMRQHNHKEEQILYPMSDHALSQVAPELLRRMAELGT
jgi:hemerythrin-like domain-containing protein